MAKKKPDTKPPKKKLLPPIKSQFIFDSHEATAINDAQVHHNFATRNKTLGWIAEQHMKMVKEISELRNDNELLNRILTELSTHVTRKEELKQLIVDIANDYLNKK